MHQFEFKAFGPEFEWYVMNSVFSWKGTIQSVFMVLPPPGVARQGFLTSTIWQENCSRKNRPIFPLCSRFTIPLNIPPVKVLRPYTTRSSTVLACFMSSGEPRHWVECRGSPEFRPEGRYHRHLPSLWRSSTCWDRNVVRLENVYILSRGYRRTSSAAEECLCSFVSRRQGKGAKKAK